MQTQLLPAHDGPQDLATFRRSSAIACAFALIFYSTVGSAQSHQTLNGMQSVSMEVIDSDTSQKIFDGAESGTSDDQDSGNKERSEHHGKLDEVVVTAQRRDERAQDVPITISVLSGEALDNSSFTSTKDALTTIPGMATLTDFNFGGTQLSLRGVTASSVFVGGSTPIAYYLDAVPVAFIRSAFVPDASVYDLQRVEVLAGPQGTLYGSSALNGVVRVLTNDADLNNFDFKGRASISSTDHGGANNDGDMAANIPIIDGKLAVRVVASDEHESGWIDTAIANHYNDIEVGNERIKVNAQPTDTLSIAASAWHSSYETGGPPIGDPNYRFPTSYGLPESNNFEAYSFRISNNFPGFSLTSTTSYISYSEFSNSIYDAPPLSYPFDTQTWSHNKSYNEELTLASTDQGPWKWSAGAFYRNAKDSYYQNFWVYPAPVTFGDSFHDESKSEAIYGELTRGFFQDKLELSAGLRYFHDTEASVPDVPSQYQISGTTYNSYAAISNATTPRAILTWKPTQDFTTYLSYGQGFRSGIPQDYLVQAAYPAAKPDKLTNYEFGVKGDAFQQLLSYTVAAYYIRWTNVQQQIGVPAPNDPALNLYVNTNAGNASGPGAEFSVDVRPAKGLSLSANFSWNDLTFDNTVYSGGYPLFIKGGRPLESPIYTAGAAISYTFPLGPPGFRGQLSASENWTSVLDNIYILPGIGASAFPSNSMLIARAQFAVMLEDHWTVALFADNLANYNGAIVGADPPILDVRTTPRTIGVRVDYHLR